MVNIQTFLVEFSKKKRKFVTAAAEHKKIIAVIWNWGKEIILLVASVSDSLWLLGSVSGQQCLRQRAKIETEKVVAEKEHPVRHPMILWEYWKPQENEKSSHAVASYTFFAHKKEKRNVG